MVCDVRGAVRCCGVWCDVWWLKAWSGVVCERVLWLYGGRCSEWVGVAVALHSTRLNVSR